jgi:leucyl aminopeptidase (aminopeptidase T)
MSSLDLAADTCVRTCLGVKKNEKVLVITDKDRVEVAEAILLKASEYGSSAEMIEIPIGKVHGEEPSSEISSKMLEYDVLFFVTSRSLSHTKARINASAKGVRVASMPTITREIMERTMSADYIKINEMSVKVASVLMEGSKIRVVTDKGTDISFSILGRESHGEDSGRLLKKGAFGNLPAGEAYIAPVEGSANGVFVVDGSIGGIGKVSEVKIEVKDGFAVDISGSKDLEIKEMLDSVKDKNAYNIAELGIGTNDKAIITGCTLEDEKVLGTCHIALGNSKSFGGDTDVPIHIDCVISDPTIYVDDKLLMEKGKLLL